LGLFVQ
jgi:hypothetical protein